MALEVTREGSFDAPGLPDAWSRLSASSPRASLFSTYQWCRCWAETVGRRAEVTLLLIQDQAGRVVGLLPACIEKAGPARWMKLLGREGVGGDHLDLLCAARDHHHCLDALLAHLERCGGLDGLVLGELHTDSPTLGRVQEWARGLAYPVHQREQRVVPWVDLPDSFEVYLDSLSANMRYHVRRRRRNADRVSGAAVRLLRDADAVDQALTDLFALHERRWRRSGQAGVFGDPAVRQFLRRFCGLACGHGQVRCYVLESGGARQCVLLAFHWAGTANFYQMGWDPDCPIKSPGVVVMAASIEQAIREGQTRYDFLRGDEQYKSKWASQSVEQTTLVVGCRAPARAVMTAERLKNRVRSVVCQTLGAGTWERMKGVAGGLSR